jgi:hypothetical protein
MEDNIYCVRQNQPNRVGLAKIDGDYNITTLYKTN